jgi:hypothetical protein
VADPVTSWVDGRIQVGVKAAVDALLSHEDEILTKAAQKFRATVVGDFALITDKVIGIPQALAGELEALPAQIGQIEAAGLQGLEALPQQVAAQVEHLAATLPAAIAQAVGNLFPHFLRHLADLPPTERDTLLRQYARQSVETPDDLAEHRKRVRDPEE